MSVNQDIEYYDVVDALQRASTGADAADCHGFLCGLICATGFADQKVWVPEVFDAYNPKDLLQAEAFKVLQSVYEDTLSRLNSPDLDFQLLLPDDEDSLRERAESLGYWCSGFLSGLGMGGLPDADGLPDELSELLEDFAQISKVDFELDNPDEDDLSAFEEVAEYIRVGVMFIHEELQPSKAPTQIQ
jgi:yecA family protein